MNNLKNFIQNKLWKASQNRSDFIRKLKNKTTFYVYTNLIISKSKAI